MIADQNGVDIGTKVPNFAIYSYLENFMKPIFQNPYFLKCEYWKRNTSIIIFTTLTKEN